MLSGTKVTMTPAADVQHDVGGERALAWNIEAGGFAAVLVSVQAREHVVNFVFLTSTGGKLARLDALALARTGVARLLAT